MGKGQFFMYIHIDAEYAGEEREKDYVKKQLNLG